MIEYMDFVKEGIDQRLDSRCGEYRHWEVTIKEKGNPTPITTEMHGVYDENDVVRHFGLKNDDVEWYKLREL